MSSANVHSLGALQDWHAALVTFRTDAAEALAAVDLEVRRAYDWVAEQQRFWRQAVRDCEEAVFVAKQELNARKYPDYSGRMPDTSEQEKALRKAVAKLEFAQDQVEVCRRWIVKLPQMVNETYDGPSRRLGAFLEAELPRALTTLDRRIQALEAYAAIAAPRTPEESAPPPAAPPEAPK